MLRKPAAAVAVLPVVAIAILLWFRLSPWPGSMLIRRAFTRGARGTSERLAGRVPAGIVEQAALQYDRHDPAALLDIYRPGGSGTGDGSDGGLPKLPVVVWIHGGAWISGGRRDIANYLKILAARGMVTVGVDYPIAPGSRYPEPLRYVNRALGYLTEQSAALGIDTSRLVLAGDSAGSQIAAQIALLITDPDYARKVGIEPEIHPGQLRAMLLNCGAYDLRLASGGKGLQGWFLGTTLRAYSGTRDFLSSKDFRLASVLEHVDGRFPPTFITAGNDDPLLEHSLAMAARLKELGVPVDAMFFDPDHRPALGHEYQFDLEPPEGREALDRMARFVAAHTGPSAPQRVGPAETGNQDGSGPD